MLQDIVPFSWGVGVHDCVSTGVPEHPDGDDETTVRDCVPLDWQVPQSEYVYVQGCGTGVFELLTTSWVLSYDPWAAGTFTSFVPADVIRNELPAPSCETSE